MWVRREERDVGRSRAAAAPEMIEHRQREHLGADERLLEDDGEQGPAQQGDDGVREGQRGDVDDVEHAERGAPRRRA